MLGLTEFDIFAERPLPKKVVKSPATSLGIGKLVQSEIDIRKKESLGMAPVKDGGRKLGTDTSVAGPSYNVAKRTRSPTPYLEQWECLVCTLYVQQFYFFAVALFLRLLYRRNDAEHPTCSACATPRGDKTWDQRS